MPSTRGNEVQLLDVVDSHGLSQAISRRDTRNVLELVRAGHRVNVDGLRSDDGRGPQDATHALCYGRDAVLLCGVEDGADEVELRGVQCGLGRAGDIEEWNEVHPHSAVFLNLEEWFATGGRGSSLRGGEHRGKGRGSADDDVFVGVEVDVVGGADDEVTNSRIEVEWGIVGRGDAGGV